MPPANILSRKAIAVQDYIISYHLCRAKRGALVPRAAAVKEKHAVEEHTELLSKRIWQLDTEIAASIARFAELHAVNHPSVSHAPKEGMESYFKKGTEHKSLNPHKAYEPLHKAHDNKTRLLGHHHAELSV